MRVCSLSLSPRRYLLRHFLRRISVYLRPISPPSSSYQSISPNLFPLFLPLKKEKKEPIVLAANQRISCQRVALLTARCCHVYTISVLLPPLCVFFFSLFFLFFYFFLNSISRLLHAARAAQSPHYSYNARGKHLFLNPLHLHPEFLYLLPSPLAVPLFFLSLQSPS